MKKQILTIILILLSLGSVTYAYYVSQLKTSEHIIKIGNADVKGIALTPLYDVNATLVPITVQTTNVNEVKYVQFSLYVESDNLTYYRLDTDLPEEFRLTSNKVELNYATGTTYTLTLELLEQVDYTQYTFYVWVNFIQ